MLSLNSSFTPSATVCRIPKGPARLGPMRFCMSATTLRSIHTSTSTTVSNSENAATTLMAASRKKAPPVSITRLPGRAAPRWTPGAASQRRRLGEVGRHVGRAPGETLVECGLQLGVAGVVEHLDPLSLLYSESAGIPGVEIDACRRHETSQRRAHPGLHAVVVEHPGEMERQPGRASGAEAGIDRDVLERLLRPQAAAAPRPLVRRPNPAGPSRRLGRPAPPRRSPCSGLRRSAHRGRRPCGATGRRAPPRPVASDRDRPPFG